MVCQNFLNKKLFTHKVLEQHDLIAEIWFIILNVSPITFAMKLLYILLATFGALFAGYMIINDFRFDNISFSNYLITTIFILLLCCLVAIGLAVIVSFRKKHSEKNVMTIRQYYQYKDIKGAR
jgi:predicted histidine transporter YuiF (NhaC family)